MQREFLAGGENVRTVLRKEGDMAKPEDTQCSAAINKRDKDGKVTESRRCKNDIVYDPESDAWSRWCEKHTTQENTARTEGGERVEKYVEA